MVLKIYILEPFTEENRFYFRSEFLNLDQIIIVESCLIHCRLFNHIPGLSLLGGRSISLLQPKMFPDTAKYLLRGKSALSGEPLI